MSDFRLEDLIFCEYDYVGLDNGFVTNQLDSMQLINIGVMSPNSHLVCFKSFRNGRWTMIKGHIVSCQSSHHTYDGYSYTFHMSHTTEVELTEEDQSIINAYWSLKHV